MTIYLHTTFHVPDPNDWLVIATHRKLNKNRVSVKFSYVLQKVLRKASYALKSASTPNLKTIHWQWKHSSHPEVRTSAMLILQTLSNSKYSRGIFLPVWCCYEVPWKSIHWFKSYFWRHGRTVRYVYMIISLSLCVLTNKQKKKAKSTLRQTYFTSTFSFKLCVGVVALTSWQCGL
jgi:hypothetical protein